MTMEGLPYTIYNVESVREWYENDTILVDKDGLAGTVTQVGAGVFNTSTILVDNNGLAGTTTEV